MIDDGRALFQQIAEQIADSIVDGTLPEESRAPSTNELAAFHRINPATAAKGINMLVDQEILYKQRGVGMFVATGARDVLRRGRQEAFAARFIDPLLGEAQRLGLDSEDLVSLIRDRTGRQTPTISPEGDLQ